MSGRQDQHIRSGELRDTAPLLTYCGVVVIVIVFIYIRFIFIVAIELVDRICLSSMSIVGLTKVVIGLFRLPKAAEGVFARRYESTEHK